MFSSGFWSASKEIDGKGVDARFGGKCQLSDIRGYFSLRLY